VLGLLDVLRGRLPDDARPFLHQALTTQDVVDTATMILIVDALQHLTELADGAVEAMHDTIQKFGTVATQARSFLQSADVTTVGFRTARWLDQLHLVRKRAVWVPAQLGGLIGDRMGISDEVIAAVCRRLHLDVGRPWHTNRAPIIALVDIATEYARWADKVGGDIAQLVQLCEITTRAGARRQRRQAESDRRNGDGGAEACLGVSTVVTRQAARVGTARQLHASVRRAARLQPLEPRWKPSAPL
jgi:3-carboxy-cis,cis-muconate cycloisomerase